MGVSPSLIDPIDRPKRRVLQPVWYSLVTQRFRQEGRNDKTCFRFLVAHKPYAILVFLGMMGMTFFAAGSFVLLVAIMTIAFGEGASLLFGMSVLIAIVGSIIGIALALARAMQIWEAGRYRTGCCANCGYDLRGNANAIQCPECGMTISTATRPRTSESGDRGDKRTIRSRHNP